MLQQLEHVSETVSTAIPDDTYSEDVRSTAVLAQDETVTIEQLGTWYKRRF